MFSLSTFARRGALVSALRTGLPRLALRKRKTGPVKPKRNLKATTPLPIQTRMGQGGVLLCGVPLVGLAVCWIGYQKIKLLSEEQIVFLISRDPQVRIDAVAASIETVPMPKSIVIRLKNMLFSEYHCDIKFICDDGQVFPAHKAILATSSPYFAAAFQGPWAENGSSGEWKTSHDSSILKAFLTFLYIGDIDVTLFSERPIDIFLIASEYDTSHLKDLALEYCIATVSAGNFKEMLQLAHLHDLLNLKTACYEYAKKNTFSVLTNPGVMELQNEDAALWAEFATTVNPESS